MRSTGRSHWKSHYAIIETLAALALRKAKCLRPSRPTSLLLVLSFLVVAIWFGGANYLYFLDEVFPFNARADSTMFGGAWNPLFNMGDPTPYSLTLLPYFYYVDLLQSVLIPSWIAEYLYYALLLFLGSLGATRAASLALGGQGTVSWKGLPGGLLYTFNPVAIVVVYPNGAPLGNALFAFLPWVYLFYRRGMNRIFCGGRFPLRDFLLAALCSIPVIGSNVPSNLSIFVVFVTVSLHSFLRRTPRVESSRVWRHLAFAVGVPLFGLVINSWWVLPQLTYTLSIIGSPNSGNFFQVDLSKGVWLGGTKEATIPAVLALAGFPNWGWQSVNVLYTGTSPFVLLGLAIPVMVFSGMIFIEGRAARGEWLFHTAVVLFLVGALSGIHSPLAPVWEILLQNPVLAQILRFPWFSLASSYVLYYSILFAISSNALGRRLLIARPLIQGKRHGDKVGELRALRFPRPWSGILVAVMLLVLVVYPFPLWTGQVIPDNPVSGRVSIPDYVIEAASFLKAHSAGYHVLTLPPGECLELSNWSQGYIGQSILALLSGVPTIYSPCRNAGGTEGLLRLAYSIPETDLIGSNYSNLLAMLNVKYVVVRWDAGGPLGTTYPTPDPAHISWFLRNQPGITFVVRFGEYEIFQIAQPLQEIFASTAAVTSEALWSYRDITSMFFNDSVLPIGGARFATVFPDMVASQLIYRVALVNYTGGPPRAMNSIPLNVNTSLYPTLRIRFSASPATAVTFMASSTTAFGQNRDFWSGDPLPLVAEDGGNASLGPQWQNFYSPRGNVSLSFNLRSLEISSAQYPTGSAISPLNYLTIVFWPLVNNDPVSWVTELNRTLDVTIDSIEVGTSSVYLTPSNTQTSGNWTSVARQVPQDNFTETYFQKANASGPSGLIGTADWSYESDVGYVTRYNRTLGSYALLVNREPLGLNVSDYTFLDVKFTAPPSTAVVVMASSSPILNSTSLWTGDPIPMMAINSQVASLSRHWINWYTGSSTQGLVFDLKPLTLGNSYYPSGTDLGVLNYLAFVLYPVAEGAPVFGPIPTEYSPEVTIQSLELLKPLLNTPPLSGMDQYKPFNPYASLIVDSDFSTSAGADVTPKLSIVESRSTEYVIEGTTQGYGGFFVTLAQNFDPGWQLFVDDSPQPEAQHMIGNQYANTWYIPPGTFAENATWRIVIRYAPQSIVETGAGITVAGLGSLVTLVGAVAVVGKRRRGVRSTQDVLPPGTDTK